MRDLNVVLCGAVLAMMLGGCVSVQQQRSEAISAYQIGDYERAKTLFAGVIQRKPIDAVSYYYLGAIEHAQKNYVGAMHCYEQSLRRAPSYEPAQVGMAQAKIDLGPELFEKLRTNPSFQDPVIHRD
ncbi:MAG: hypothetical protein FWE88_07690 [Phycisphaerae bacterium]|nr:hypothetical protein [Phycisphaerae bacterium]